MRTCGPHLRIRLSLPGVLCVTAFALALAARAGAGAEADAPPIERPVMMDSNGPGSELYVLDDAGVLHAYSVSENGLSEFGRISVPQGFTAADMSFLRSQSPASVLIAGTQAGSGLVLRLALDSRSLKSWGFQNVCSGVDSGASGHSAYVATSDSNDLYRVDPQGSPVTFVAHIPDASKLGPVAFDEAGQEIYIADVASGKIYQYSIASRTSKTFVTGLSAPTALAFDAETNRLFVADPGQRAIFAVDTRADKPAAVPFASSPLRAPYGMTLISEDRVAVADYSANRIFVFSGKGALLFRYPSK
jgi:DNA-binding beta-propeller fold protein YncE